MPAHVPKVEKAGNLAIGLAKGHKTTKVAKAAKRTKNVRGSTVDLFSVFDLALCRLHGYLARATTVINGI